MLMVRKKHIPWLILAFLLIIIVGLTRNISNSAKITDSAEQNKTNRVDVQEEEKEAMSNTTRERVESKKAPRIFKENKTKKVDASQVQLTNEAIELAISVTKQELLVSDAAISHKDSTISMAIVVNAATNKQEAKRLGDNFARQLAAFSGGKQPDKYYLGELWDNYTLLIIVADSSQKTIVQGAKVRGGTRITW